MSTTVMPVRRAPATVVLTTASVTLPFDASIAVGDVMLLVVEQVSTAAVPAPAGWTRIASQAHGSRTGHAYTKVRESGETSVQLVRSPDGAGRATVAGLGGVDPAKIIVGAPRSRATSPADTSTTTTALGVATTAPKTVVVGIFGEATTTAEAAGFVPTVTNATVWAFAGQQSTGDLESILLTYRETPTASAAQNMVAAYPNVQASNGWGMQIAFPGVEIPEAAPSPVARLAAKVVDQGGALVDVGLVGWDGSHEVALSKLEYVHGGTFVSELERLDCVFTMGHRGGSADYQEHSIRGFFQSAVAHMDVLEFSVGVTSDGVFFGLHDSTLNRTSSALGPAATSPVRAVDRTWAQVQELDQDLPDRGDTRFGTAKYLRLEDFVDRWLGTHTLMFDPKVLSSARRAQLLTYLKGLPDHENRVMGKFFHTGTVVADEFHAIGCKVWGYAYPEAITGLVTDGTATKDPLLSTTASRWDMLGMEHNASAAVWAETLRIAGGKKVIAHIVKTAQEARAAVAKGATGLQVAGVNAVSAAY